MAQSLLCEGKIAEAVQLRKQVTGALHPEDTSAGGTAALDLAHALLLQGELAEAEAAATTAAATLARTLGPRHPLTRAARLAVVEAQLRSPTSSATAEQSLTHLLADLRERREPDALRAHALLLSSERADARGDREAALHLVARAIQEYEAALGGTHPELASALITAGDLLLAAGRAQEAEADYRQVAAILDTLGQSDSAHLAHARAGIQLARWGARPPADAADTLQWGIAPTGGAIDPAVTGWIAAQLGRLAAARGDHAAALAQYRAAAAAWQQSGDRHGAALALTAAALLAAQLHDPGARTMLEEALQTGPIPAADDRPRLQSALAKLLWPAQRDRALALAHAALADLPEASSDAADLKQWLKHHETQR
jgi:tetratricopeptide (TPR) repeat protein